MNHEYSVGDEKGKRDHSMHQEVFKIEIMLLYKIPVSLFGSALCYLGMIVSKEDDVILETSAKNSLKLKLFDSSQSTPWYLDPLGQAAPVHTDVSGSSLLT